MTEFLLKKSGKTWDNVPEASATFADIDDDSVKTFIKDAEKSGRMPDVHIYLSKNYLKNYDYQTMV